MLFSSRKASFSVATTVCLRSAIRETITRTTQQIHDLFEEMTGDRTARLAQIEQAEAGTQQLQQTLQMQERRLAELRQRAETLRGELAAAGVVSIEARESSDIDASVRCRELNGTFSGASDAVLSGFSGNLYCNLSGDSDMKVSGTAGIVSVKCSGVSDFDGAGLVTQSCRAEASAASRIALGPVEKELSANSSGVSSITYRGNPSLGSVVHSSTSSVRQVH